MDRLHFPTRHVYLCRMQKRPHVVLLGPAWPYRGGPALFMTFLYEALQQSWRVDFVNFRMMYPKLLFPGTSPLDKSRETYKKIPGPRLLHSLHPWYWWKTARHLRRLDPDLILFDWYQPFFGPMYFGIGLFLPQRLRRRIAFITENVISHEARRVDYFLTRLGLYWSRGYIALSQKVADDLPPFSGDKPVLRSELPIFRGYRASVHSPEEQRQAFGIGDGDRVLLFFGYIRHYKGLDILIEALALLHAEYPRYRLLIAGECYEDPEHYRALIRQHGLEDRVHFENAYIDNEAVTGWFAVADVVVLPYRSATQSGILNMAYGFEKPAVTTNVGGLSEFVEDGNTGILVPEATAEAVAEGVRRFYRLRETHDFAAAIRERVAGNAFGKIVDVVAALREKINPADPAV